MINVEKIISDNIDISKRVKFINVGACNGVRGDPLYEFIKKHNWRGVLIEPGNDAFKELQSNYAGMKDIILTKMAIHPTDKKAVLYVPNKLSASSLFKKLVATKKKKKITKQVVDCCTLQEIIEQYNMYDVEVLHIDTEGMDFEVIQTVDFNKVKPNIISYERHFLNNCDCDNYLKDKGYDVFVDDRHGVGVLVN